MFTPSPSHNISSYQSHVLYGGGGYPSAWSHALLGGCHNQVLIGGVRGYPTRSQGYPSQIRMGVPPSQDWIRVSPESGQDKVSPSQDNPLMFTQEDFLVSNKIKSEPFVVRITILQIDIDNFPELANQIHVFNEFLNQCLFCRD